MNIFNTLPPDGYPFLENKYTHWYYEIISRAKKRENYNEYTERHHIVPDCFYINNRSKGRYPGWLDGNSNAKENIVILTAKEHFICHLLLTKMVPINSIGYIKMQNSLAAFIMTKLGYRIITAQQYEKCKIAARLAKLGVPLTDEQKLARRHTKIKNGTLSPSVETRLKIGAYHKGRKRSPDACKNISNGKIGKTRVMPPMKAETKEKLRIANKGKGLGEKRAPHSDETKQKISAALIGKRKGLPSPKKGIKTGKSPWNKGLTGRKQTKEANEKRSKSLKGRPSPLKGKPSGRKGIQSPNKGKHLTDEQRLARLEKMRNNKRLKLNS